MVKKCELSFTVLKAMKNMEVKFAMSVPRAVAFTDLLLLKSYVLIICVQN